MLLVDLIDRAINERGSAAILRERLVFIQEQAQALEKKVVELEKENADLKKRERELEQQLATKTARDDFVECRGALFKRKPAGGYHRAVYCPRCQGPMMSLLNMPYHCNACHVSVDFTGCQLETVMRELSSDS